MRIVEFKKRFLEQSLESRQRILSDMKKDVDNSKQERTEPQQLMFLNLIKWSEKNLNKDL